MTTPRKPSREHPNTYIVQDRSNEQELTRLQIQDRLITTSMGGVLPEQTDLDQFKRILDVGCGTGNWLIEVALAYPKTTELVGVDASGKMLDFARIQAQTRGVDDRTKFLLMDALRMLEFPKNFFDLVNLRFGMSYLRTWDWPVILQDFQRVTRPGGMIRLTESNMIESNSPNLSRLYDLVRQAFYAGGHFFYPEGDGVTRELAQVLSKSGVQNVQTRTHTLLYRAGTEEGAHYAEDMRHTFRNLLPFLRKWIQVPDEYELLYQQAMEEMQQPGFVATWHLLTAWGKNPTKTGALAMTELD